MSKNKIMKKWFKGLDNLENKKNLIALNDVWVNKESVNIREVEKVLEPLCYVLLENDVSKHHIVLIMDNETRVYYSFSNLIYKKLFENNESVIHSIEIKECKSKNGYTYLSINIEGENNIIEGEDDIEF